MLAAAHVAASVACAEGTNGVSPTAISRPSGPGSLEGLGTSFQPTLNTGTARHEIPFDLPSGVAGFTPALSLRYDGGQGFGVAGFGWEFGPPCIQRQVEEGLPRYGMAPDGETISDRFLGVEGEELVPLRNGYFLAKIAGSYIRYRQTGSHWTAHSPSGIKWEFGITPQARLTNDDGTKTFQWCLERQTDTHGNVMEYTYRQPAPAARQIYLSEVRYGPGAPPWDHAYTVRMTYEDRPDAFSDYRAGFLVQTLKRLARVELLYNDLLIRRYVFGYEAHPHWSFLTTITTYGADGVSALPPTQFGYSLFDGGDSGTLISASGHVVGSTGEPPEALDSEDIGLIDLNADGLPDLLATESAHTAYLNRGVRSTPGGPATLWEGPIDVTSAEQRTHLLQLSSERVHLADMTGDAIADLVVVDSADQVEYFANSGASGWRAGQLMDVGHTPPPSPFAPQSASAKTADLDFNKRIDIIQSQKGALFSWYNQGDGRYTGPMVTDAPFDGSSPVELSDTGVFLADMNGDRLVDIAKITSSRVIWWANAGYAKFGLRVEMALPDRSLEEGPDGNLHRAKLEDISGDGLSDLVVERALGAELWFWQNLGNGQFDMSRVVIDLPVTPGATAHWADLNGNGTTDLIYSDVSLPSSRIQFVDLGELIGGSDHSNLLTSIDYAYGRKSHIEYRTTTELLIEAMISGNPWTTTIPFPSHVVSATRTTIGLDLDGYPDEGPDGDTYMTEFLYRDGYHDPIEHQFRGFAFVKQIDRGDERFGGSDAPTLMTRHGFHTGAPDGVDNDGDGEIDEAGDLWTGREEEGLKGVQLWMEVASLPDDSSRDGLFANDSVVFERTASTWEVRDLCRASGGALVDLLSDTGYEAADEYGREVRQVVLTQTDQSILERGQRPAKLVRTHSDVDALGRSKFEWMLGDVANPADDYYTGNEYALNETAWIVDRLSKTFVYVGSETGAFVSETRNYYDGVEFVGLPLGQLGTRGLMHRTESVISPNSVPPLPQRTLAIGDPRTPNAAVDTLRRSYDAYGNAIVLRDARGYDRLIGYDRFVRKFPISETVVVGGGKPDLQTQAIYDLRLGRMLALTDMNGRVTQFTYDTFGRLTAEIVPGDDVSSPTRSYSYDLAAPISAITTIARDNVGPSQDVETKVFFDGLGRRLGKYAVGGDVMSEITLFNARGQARKVFQPYFGGDGSWAEPAPTTPATTNSYDARGRLIRVVSAPDELGVSAITTTEHSPLQMQQFDGEDNNVDGPHENTPRTLISDGLGRLIEVHEVESLSQVDAGMFVTRYRYAAPDLIGEIEDANGNVKYTRYDGLGRKIFINDLDRGHLTYTYDSVGNLISRVDAMSRETVYTYDGANRRLTEDFLDNAHPLSLLRTPDVAYFYDAPNPQYVWLTNLKGKLSWVEDHTGSEYFGYDDRGHPVMTIKRIDRLGGDPIDYSTQSIVDRLGRVYQVTYPDGDTVRFSYDGRGLLQNIPGFVDQFTYMASGQKEACQLANGVLSTYSYDPRLRMTALLTESPGATLQDLAYDYDQMGNVLAIGDGRPLSPGDLRNQSATFVVDDLYRLQGVAGLTFGSIAYDYDRLGNMASKSSPDILDDDVNLGTLTSGGAGGTSGRIGRDPADPPGPHALTETDNGSNVRTMQYDANGNMTFSNGDVYVYDFADRLGRVIKDGQNIRYLYDHAGRRVIKRVDGVQTSYINNAAEVRNGEMIKYVTGDAGRIARIEGTMPPPPSTTQFIELASGWNLISFQVNPGETDPAVLLADIDGLYVSVYGHNGSEYTRFIPGALDNTLAALIPNRGYWIRMTQPAQLVMEGPVSTAPVNVSAGTPMLIGFPGLGVRFTSALATQFPGFETVWAFDTDSNDWTNYTVTGPQYLNSLAATQAGKGYWILCNAPMTLTTPAPGNVFYYHTDHLGSTNLVTDSAGEIVTENYNYPFGSLRHKYEPNGSFDPYYQYTGKERDAESGLHYFGARYYDSMLARFVTVDPHFGENHAAMPSSHPWPQQGNLYAMALNNPVEMIDPSGLAAKHTVTDYGTYEIESTVYVYFDEGTDMHNWLNPGGEWDPERAKQVQELLDKNFRQRVRPATEHSWGVFTVDAKFVVTPEKPELSAKQQKSSTLLRFRRRTQAEKDARTWGECGPAAGQECWFGEDEGGGSAKANIWVDSSGELRHSGKGHFHEVLHGFGLPHAVARNKAGEMTEQGVPDIMGYNTHPGDHLTKAYQTEFVIRVLRLKGAESQTFYGTDTWGVGDITSPEIQAAYDAANP